MNQARNFGTAALFVPLVRALMCEVFVFFQKQAYIGLVGTWKNNFLIKTTSPIKFSTILVFYCFFFGTNLAQIRLIHTNIKIKDQEGENSM